MQHLEMRTVCLVCGNVGAWVRKPGDALADFSNHLVAEHPDVLRDPAKLRKARKDEFQSVPDTLSEDHHTFRP